MDEEMCIVRLADKRFLGTVRRRFDDGCYQVTTRAARIVGASWESLVFNAQNEGICSAALCVFPASLAEFAELAELIDEAQKSGTQPF